MANRAVQNCLAKKRFHTQQSAAYYLQELVNKVEKDSSDFQIYHCPICGGYHFTSLKKGKRN